MSVLINQERKIFTNNGKALLYPDISTPTTLEEVQNLLNVGMLDKGLDIGDQVLVEYNDETMAVDFVHCENQRGKQTAYFQFHDIPLSTILQFDAPEAIYYTSTNLAPGQYYIEIKTSAGSGWVNGSYINFTLTKQLPAGGQIYIDCGNGLNINPGGSRKLTTYAERGSQTILETTTTSVSNAGTKLGETYTNQWQTNGHVNAISRVVYGYNRWSQSAVRQYLNSTELSGAWWHPQHPWDRPMASFNNIDGFLSKCSSDFLSHLTNIDVVTAIGSYDATTNKETTQDKMFIPALNQMYIENDFAFEGNSWNYYRQLAQQVGLSDKFETNVNYVALKKYHMASSSTGYSLRTPDVDRLNYEWFIDQNGRCAIDTAITYLKGLCPSFAMKQQ